MHQSFVYLSLYALQHRGQEACGIVSFADGRAHSMKSFGLVGDTFNEENLRRLVGHIAIGHNRYSTQGGTSVQNIQLFIFRPHSERSPLRTTAINKCQRDPPIT